MMVLLYAAIAWCFIASLIACAWYLFKRAYLKAYRRWLLNQRVLEVCERRRA